MNIATAKEILTRAKADEIFDGEIPEANDEILTQAGEIIALAEQAWASNVRGPEVETILKLAASDQNGEAPEDSEADSDSTDNSTESEQATPEGTPSIFVGLPKNLAKSEPWEGYGDGSVKDVTEGIIWFGENSPDEILDILKNVWAFESEHKERSRILNFVKEAFVKFGGDLGSEVGSERIKDSEGAEETSEIGSESDSGPDDGSGVSTDEELSTEESESDSGESDSDAESDAEPEASQKSSEGKTSKTESTEKDSSGGSGRSASVETKLVALVEKELARERLDGIPNPPQEKAPELPWNWSDITDIQLHDLHMQYASLAYYKAYQRSRDERIAMHCKEAADEIRNKLLVEMPKYDEKNKEIRVTVIEAQIASHPNIKRWRKAQSKYERFAHQARHELESLHKLVEALSRLETMRHDAWERARR